ncbi:hypothetical protein HNQ91_004195 [Filimonas zeae]|uniref:Uncharacterized protein n=1 Tax=Filimonas zeae TaxID=1737353 RepID=A0A917J252_9BACT|nr:hypothetical protein [Filimonas zeae]MDR6341122.1 hypothetical protein [Filimonas zeae]GGH77140.1 hypothetical protein GCM10011379_43040 [Filimonas zeae]
MAIYVCDNPPPPGNYGRYQVYIDRGRSIGRVPNPLDSGRVKNAPEFANTRKHAALLAKAAPLASAAHRTLPDNRKRTHYQQLAGMAIQWLKQDKQEAEIQLLLQEATALMRRQLKRQKVQELLAERKKDGKRVFALPSPVVPERGGGEKRVASATVASAPVLLRRLHPLRSKKRRTGFYTGPPFFVLYSQSLINGPEFSCLTRFSERRLPAYLPPVRFSETG